MYLNGFGIRTQITIQAHKSILLFFTKRTSLVYAVVVHGVILQSTAESPFDMEAMQHFDTSTKAFAWFELLLRIHNRR